MADHQPESPPAEIPINQAETAGSIIKRLGALGPLALIAALFPAIGGFVLLYYIKSVGDWFVSHGTTGPWLYAAAFALAAGLAILPTYAPAVLGGFAFGFLGGLPAALGGFLGGSLIGFAVASRASGQRVQKIINEHPMWRAVYEGLLGGGALKTLGLVTLIRLNSPFALTNLILAATRVPLWIYTLGTLIGLSPRTAAAVYIGSTLSNLGDAAGKPRWLIFTSIAAAILVVMVIGHIANQAITRFTATQQPGPGA